MLPMVTWHNGTMAESAPRRSRLSIDVDPELRRRVRIAAASRDRSVRHFVEDLIREALAKEPTEDSGWSAVSARSFARDWSSDEDSVYDQPA